jgi:hypothetical protein
MPAIRYWTPLSVPIDLDEDGFLRTPSEYCNTQLKQLAAIRDDRPLLLIGEPGLGKSTEVEQFAPPANLISVGRSGTAQWVSQYLNLRAAASEHEIRSRLEALPAWLDWQQQKLNIELWIDGLDEGLQNAIVLGAALLQVLGGLEASRLRIRVACRSFEWPGILRTGLDGIFGADRTAVWELAPLDRPAAESIATELAINDVTAFLDAVVDKAAGSFATHPVSLQFLVESFKRDGGFPSTRVALFKAGLLHRCDEQNTYLDPVDDRALTAQERRTVAARVAAATMLANREAVWIGANLTNVPITDTPYEEMCGGVDPVLDDSTLDVSVDRAAMRETLRIGGLFTSAGPQRMAWAQRTFAEFLAAEWLVARSMPSEQLTSLLTVYVDGQPRVPPPLHEVAAWVALMQTDFFERLIELDPAVLILTDSASLTEDQRRRVTLAMLDVADRDMPPQLSRETERALSRLKFEGMGDQLASMIADASTSDAKRDMALRFGAACALTELSSLAGAIALDPTQPRGTRANAVRTLAAIADDGGALQLCEIVRQPEGNDEDDELLGLALRSLWPEYLDLSELLELLRPIQRESLFGIYRSFLYGLAETLTGQEAMEIVRWFATSDRQVDGYATMPDAVLVAAWDTVETEDDAKAFATLLRARGGARFRSADSELKELTTRAIADPARRRLIVSEALRSGGGDRDVTMELRDLGFVHHDDFDWLVALLIEWEAQSVDSIARHRLAMLVGVLANLTDEHDCDELIRAAPKAPSLAEYFGPIAGDMAIDSSEANNARELARMRQEIQENVADRRQKVDPSPTQKVAELLSKVEAGGAREYTPMERWMSVDAYGFRASGEFGDDLATTPVWDDADETLRLRIAAASRKFVSEVSRQVPDSPFNGKFTFEDLAAFRAIRLLTNDGTDLEAVPVERWKVWAPAVLVFPGLGSLGENATRIRLFRHAWTSDPVAAVEILRQLLVHDRNEHGRAFPIWSLPVSFDDAVCEMLLRLAEESIDVPAFAEDILTVLLTRGGSEWKAKASAFATGLLGGLSSSDESARALAQIAAALLLRRSEIETWDGVLSQVIASDEPVRKAVLVGLANSWDRREDGVIGRLSESQLAKLFKLFVAVFPYPEKLDDSDSGFHMVGPEEIARHFRDSLIEGLRQRATDAALVELRTMQVDLPNLPWLRWTRARARLETARRQWSAPNVRDVMLLGRDSRRRLIRNADELLDVVVESLGRLQKDLTGATPSVVGLWDQNWHKQIKKDVSRPKKEKKKKRIFRPKAESALADELQRHFRRDLVVRGIVTNREVEVRGSTSGANGSRTDVYVDAMLKGAGGNHDRLTVVVEVKGCWHPDVMNSMKSQLLDKYLIADNAGHHGVFVVGWYLTDLWDSHDYRLRAARRLKNLPVLTKTLEKQASKLSTKDRRLRAVILDTRLDSTAQ